MLFNRTSKVTEDHKVIISRLEKIFENEDNETVRNIQAVKAKYENLTTDASKPCAIAVADYGTGDTTVREVYPITIAPDQSLFNCSQVDLDTVPFAIASRMQDGRKVIWISELLNEWLCQTDDSIKYDLAETVIYHEVGHFVLNHTDTDRTYLAEGPSGNAYRDTVMNSMSLDVKNEYLRVETEADRVACQFAGIENVVMMRSYMMTHLTETGARLYNMSMIGRHLSNIDNPDWYLGRDVGSILLVSGDTFKSLMEEDSEEE